MSLLRRIENWSSSHNPKWLAFFRVILGVLLFMRGVSFLTNIDNFESLIQKSGLHTFSGALAALVPWIHIVCGFLIIMGVMTRIACFIQIPILLGAIIFITTPDGIFAFETTFSFSLIILLLLIVFFIEGGGPLSLVSYLKNNT